MKIALVGFTAAGKTTTGAMLAEKLGLPFIDVDATVCERAGESVGEIFASGGEARWRELEQSAALEVLQGSDAVIALGAGALGDPAVFTALGWVMVVYLRISFSEAMLRIGGSSETRPMLERYDPKALYDARLDMYERMARVTIDADGKTPEQIVSEILEVVSPPSEVARLWRIPVGSVPGDYEVVVGAGHLSESVAASAAKSGARSVMVLADEAVKDLAELTATAVDSTGLPATLATIEGGESSKSFAMAERVLEKMVDAGLHRGDLMVAVGGGSILDLAGFAASVYYRGIDLLSVPTTLLAQVDAAIGAKTGVNLTKGKNLAGTFHRPIGVVVDVELLASLPHEEFNSGMAEVVKYGLSIDGDLLRRISSSAGRIESRDPGALTALVGRCAEIKAQIVTADEREQGRRAVLNYGHTIGHAIEHDAGGGLRHGEAISLGMMAAAFVAESMGWIGQREVDMHADALAPWGLPVSANLDPSRLRAIWHRDKKFHDGSRLVLLRGIGHAEVGVAVKDDLIVSALERLGG